MIAEAEADVIDKPMDKMKTKLVTRVKTAQEILEYPKKMLRLKKTAEKTTVEVAKAVEGVVEEAVMKLETAMIMAKQNLPLECPYSISLVTNFPVVVAAVEMLLLKRKKDQRSLIVMIETIVTIAIGILKATIDLNGLEMTMSEEAITEMIVVIEMKGMIVVIETKGMIVEIEIMVETIGMIEIMVGQKEPMIEVTEMIGTMTEEVAVMSVMIETIGMIEGVSVVIEIMVGMKGPTIETTEGTEITIDLNHQQHQQKTKAPVVIGAKINLQDNKNKLNSIIKSMGLLKCVIPPVAMLALEEEEVIGVTEVAVAKKAVQAIVISVNGATALMWNPSSEVIMAVAVVSHLIVEVVIMEEAIMAVVTMVEVTIITIQVIVNSYSY